MEKQSGSSEYVDVRANVISGMKFALFYTDDNRIKPVLFMGHEFPRYNLPRERKSSKEKENNSDADEEFNADNPKTRKRPSEDTVLENYSSEFEVIFQRPIQVTLWMVIMLHNVISLIEEDISDDEIYRNIRQKWFRQFCVGFNVLANNQSLGH